MDQSAAGIGSFPPTDGLASPTPSRRRPETEEGVGLGRGPMGTRAAVLGGGARPAAQGRAAEAPMSARRVRGRLVRETPWRGWWLRSQFASGEELWRARVWGRAAGLVGLFGAAFVPELGPRERRQEVAGVGMAMGTGHPLEEATC